MLLLLACSSPPSPSGPQTVLAIHGMGDSPDGFANVWVAQEGYSELTPAGLHPYGDGFRWFPSRREGLGDTDIAAAAAHLASLIPEGDKAIVYGFSQGGALTMALTVNHPDKVERGIALGGWLPPGLHADPPKDAPGLLVLHGEADPIVPYDQGTIDALRERGWAVETRTWPGVGHAVPLEMRATLDGAIRCIDATLLMCQGE